MLAEAAVLPRVTLKSRRALPFFSGHPWLFAGAIAEIEGHPEAGAEVNVFAHDGTFVARGLFNPDSNIRVRLYTREEQQPLDEPYWSQRLEQAIALRRRLFQDQPEWKACRLVFSEADELSGLIVDRYGEWLVVQFTSRALAERRELIVRLLQEQLSPAGIWLRTEKGIKQAEGLQLEDGLLMGEPPPRPLFVQEHGLQYGADIVEGQKTGFYFDQRDNRRAAANYAEGARVLDLYCYSGGFSIAAARLGGARSVLGVDSSAAALRLAAGNAELNDVAGRVQFQQADVGGKLEELSGAGEKFDLVILDPPKFARHRKGVAAALKAYAAVNRAALGVVESGGLLVSCSCSGLVAHEEFEAALALAAREAGRRVKVLESRGQATDHPYSLNCLENQYLKCLICHVI